MQLYVMNIMNSLQKTTFNEGSFLYFKNTLYKKIVIYLLLSVLKKKIQREKEKQEFRDMKNIINDISKNNYC